MNPPPAPVRVTRFATRGDKPTRVFAFDSNPTTPIVPSIRKHRNRIRRPSQEENVAPVDPPGE